MTAPHELDHAPRTLSLRQRAAVGLAAGVDVGLRTAVSTVLAGAMASPSGRPRTGTTVDADALAAYAALAHRPLAELTRPNDDGSAPRRVRTAPLPARWRPGTLELSALPSTYRVAVAETGPVHAERPRNHTSWAHHWRHAGPARPTLVVLHGFGASPAGLNRGFFSVPWLYGRGLDVLLVALPFHGRRRSQRLALDGLELFSSGIGLLNEGLLQAIHDVRRWVDVLLADGAPAVAVTGLSLGGYVSAGVAAADDRLAACVPNAPVVDIATLLPQWAPAGPLALRLAERQGIDRELVADALRVHSPLRSPPQLPAEGLMVIAGLGDRLAPPEQARLLWEHWGRPRVHWFAGNHVIHFERRSYTRELADFLHERGLTMEHT